jgi:3-methyladenine DNA glycosylase Tag
MPYEHLVPAQITPKSANDYLDVMSKAVFQSGIAWHVIEAKWPSTREAFHDFDLRRVAALRERDLDALAADARVIRNRKKLEAIAGNAGRMLELEAEYGSFQKYLRSCGSFEETVKSLRQNFKFLGDSGCYWFLWVVKEPVPPYEEWSASRDQSAPRSTAPRAAVAPDSPKRARRR